MNVKRPSSSLVEQPNDEAGAFVRGRSRDSIRWPHPDYARAAIACAHDPIAFEKLIRLCDDLETPVLLTRGPGTLVRTARVPIEPLKEIEGKCWREVLLDASHGRLVWIGLRNYGVVLTSDRMDSGTRRTGQILHAVAVVRLETLGEKERQLNAQRNLIERNTLLEKLYLPRFVARVNRQGVAFETSNANPGLHAD